MVLVIGKGHRKDCDPLIHSKNYDNAISKFVKYPYGFVSLVVKPMFVVHSSGVRFPNRPLINTKRGIIEGCYNPSKFFEILKCWRSSCGCSNRL